MSKIIAVANQKGGVGKTTTALNLAAALAASYYETLLIDFDPQGNSTSGFGIRKNNLKASIYNALIDNVPLEEIVIPTGVELCSIAPSGLDLVGAEVELVNVPERASKLKEALAKYKKVYDFIIIDCPPALGLLTENAFTAANSIIIPIQCEYYALEGLGQLLKFVEMIKMTFNPHLAIEGVLLTMYDSRVNLSSQVQNQIKKYFGEKVYKTIIPRTIRLAEAPGFGQPIITYDKRSTGAEAYINLSKEVIAKEKEHRRLNLPELAEEKHT
ncbi:MAG: Sporulation initiation inhibitor protein Soj [Elusimicrobia bacterium ADurb.Bin231]|nr:MAG: Sporulation initiation inhibitor protein Soj [Elusimicrobia bacterium ADurb.Bin231]